MKGQSRLVVMSAAVIAALYGSSTVRADYIWDPSQSPTGGSDGGGTWDLTTPNWYNGTSNTVWDNITPASAQFGDLASVGVATAGFNLVDLGQAITVQNVTLGTATNGAYYILTDSGGGLTLNGNVTKASTVGGTAFAFTNNGLTLSNAAHTFAINDTSGDATPEFSINGQISGSGSIIMDNGTFAAYGTMADIQDNNYSGGTVVNKGRLVIATDHGLGTGSVNIGTLGALSVGGGGIVPNSVTLDNTITISRNTYAGGDAGNYTDALISANSGPNQTVSVNHLVVDSTDGRVAAQTSILNLPNTVLAGANAGTTSLLTLDGDFAGTINLGGNNSVAGSVGGIKIMGGVEVNFSNLNNLGGSAKQLQMAGGTLHIPSSGFASDAALNIATAGFGGGFDIDSGTTFTLAGNYTGTGVGRRGTGTFNVTGNDNFAGGGQSFFDGGVNNITGTLLLGSLNLRSPIVNVTGAVVSNVGSTNWGASQGGTNGNPDKATVNISGNGSYTQTNNDDFNISGDALTAGTLNLSGNGQFNAAGLVFVGRNRGAVGTINQTGGSMNLTRNGNFTFVLGDGRNGNGTILSSSSGVYNLSGGTFTSAGEVYLGEGNNNAGNGTIGVSGTGTWNQSGGTATINNWLVLGREGAVGTFIMTGGALTHNGGNMSMGDTANATGAPNYVALSNNASINNIGGEFWLANSTGDKASMFMSGSSSLATNNWFAIGRGGGLATLDLSGNASITKAGSNNSYVGEATTAVVSTMTMHDNSSFTATTGEFWLGQGGGIGQLTIQDNAKFTVNSWLALGRANGASVGTLNLNGGTLTRASGSSGYFAVGSGGAGYFNQTGGVANSFGNRFAEASNGTINISGGTDNFSGETSIGYSGVANFTVSGTANVTLNDTQFGRGGGTAGGTLNLNGGTVTANSFTVGTGATGPHVISFNGGTLAAGIGTTNFVGTLMTSTVGAGGANINSNGLAVTYNSVLTHSTALGSTVDGGLDASGTGTLTLTGASTYTGPTIVDKAGVGSIGSGALAVTYSASGASGATPILNNAGGTDIRHGSLVLNYAGSTTPASTVRSDLVASYGTGSVHFATGQIRSSTATSAIGLGYSDDGVSKVQIKSTYYGDVNLDGKVDIADLGQLATYYGQSGTTWQQGDFNYDGTVSIADLGALATNYGAGSTTPLAISFSQALSTFGLPQVAVPEPTSLTLVGLGGAALLGRRRRKI